LIYLDTSVALAQILAEDRYPPEAFWREPLVSSRLLEYEVWTRIHAKNLGPSHGEHARNLLSRIAFLELAPPVLTRALEPFPLAVRTLDALHLASMVFLRNQREDISLASYDERLAAAATRLGIPLSPHATL
jgi:hypothetical protein